MQAFLEYTLGGIAVGMIYAAIALSLVLIWRGTRVLNYSQGGMAMFTTYVAWLVIRDSGNYWAGFAVALASGLVLGAVLERAVVRPTEGKSPLNSVIVTIGLLIFLARLLGVRIGRVLTLGWALAGLFGALAGVLVTPSTFLYPNSMDSIFVLGFTAAVIGGLDSPAGAVAGGVLLGVVLSYAGGYLGSNLVLVYGLAVLVLVLMIRPSGLFSAATARRV